MPARSGSTVCGNVDAADVVPRAIVHLWMETPLAGVAVENDVIAIISHGHGALLTASQEAVAAIDSDTDYVARMISDICHGCHRHRRPLPRCSSADTVRWDPRLMIGIHFVSHPRDGKVNSLVGPKSAPKTGKRTLFED